jgi:hypothetical protein
MKQKDVAIIIIAVFISVVISIILSKMLVSAPKNRQLKVTIVDPITAEFNAPDKKYFNETSIDPTKLIRVGDNNNTAPFNTPR